MAEPRWNGSGDGSELPDGTPSSSSQPALFDLLCTPEQVAEHLNVSPNWVHDHSSRKEPRLPVIRLGGGPGRAGLLRYRASKIEEFIEEMECRRHRNSELTGGDVTNGSASVITHRLSKNRAAANCKRRKGKSVTDKVQTISAREWLDLRSLTQYASVSERTVRAWIHRHENPLPAVQVGNKLLVKKKAL